jgi:hypothetical protein
MSYRPRHLRLHTAEFIAISWLAVGCGGGGGSDQNAIPSKGMGGSQNAGAGGSAPTSGGSDVGVGGSVDAAAGTTSSGGSSGGSSAAGSGGSMPELGPIDTLPLPAVGTAGIAYLSDLTESAGAINGWGPVEKDMTNGWTEAGDGAAPIDLFAGATYEKGIGCHSWSEVSYDLAGKYRMFVADIGYTFNETPGGTVVFQVVVDGETKFDSGTINADSERAQTINVDVTGGATMDLIVTDAGDGIYADHVAWAGARLVE